MILRTASGSTVFSGCKPPADDLSHFCHSRVFHLFELAGYRRSMTKTATPFGRATMLERVTLPQTVGGKRFATVLELLETERGDRLVRVAYTTDGAVRRGPVTLRPRDLARLREALAKAPALASILEEGA